MDNPRHLTDTHREPPAEAFRFLAPATLAAAADSDAPRQLSGVAYSGGVIEPHAYWGRVVFDLGTTEIPERVPVLVDHDRSRRVGVARLAVQNSAIVIAEGQLLGNDQARQVAEDADAGFPWQLSVHIDPARVQQVEPGESVVVNGTEHAGPLFVFRQSRIREVSLTPTGADHRTSAQIFSASTPGAPQMQQQQNETVEGLRQQLAERDARIAALSDQVAQFSAAQRQAEVRALFGELGREFSAEAAAPYLALDATAFAAVAADLRAHKPKPTAATPASSAPAHLFSEQATGGESGEELSPSALADRARQFQARAEAEGRIVSTAEAVRAVKAQAATAHTAQ